MDVPFCNSGGSTPRYRCESPSARFVRVASRGERPSYVYLDASLASGNVSKIATAEAANQCRNSPHTPENGVDGASPAGTVSPALERKCIVPACVVGLRCVAAAARDADEQPLLINNNNNNATKCSRRIRSRGATRHLCSAEPEPVNRHCVRETTKL